MTNEFLPKCYFENELEYLQEAYYGRLQEKMQQTIDQLLPYPKASQFAIRRLAKQLTSCTQVYGLLKLLLMTHHIIRNIPMGKLLLLESLSSIQLSHIKYKYRFEEYLINQLLKDYIDYLKKMCASCRIYSFCVGLYTEDEPQIYFYGAINMIQYCWPILDKFQHMESILKQTYPFLLDIFVNVAKDARDISFTIWNLLKQLSSSGDSSQQSTWQNVTNELREINHRIQVLFEIELLKEEVGAPQLQQIIPVTEFYDQDLRDFMESNTKQKSL